MSAKQFFIAHGEKVAISLTLLLVAAQCYVTFTDSSIRPANISPGEIDIKNSAIDAVFQQGKAPILKPVPGYLNDMEARFDKANLPVPSQSWLTAAPDRGPGSGGLLLYVFEVPGPTVAAVDTVGSAELTIILPTPNRNAGKRLSDSLSATWERSAEGITNRAEDVGVVIETHRGDNQWKPLVAKVLKQGFISLTKLEDLGGKIATENLEPWIRHSFRARLIAKATGLDLEQAIQPKATASVVVVPGTLIPEGEDVSWGEFTEKVRAKDAKTLSKLAKPTKDVAPGVTLAADEKLYSGANSEVVGVQVTSNVRFALDKVGADLTDPTKEVASFLVTKQFTLKVGDKQWLKTPQSFKAAIGDTVGGMAKTEIPTNPGQIVNVDLTTPFKVVEIKRQQKRILYWEILPESRAGGKGKDLKAQAKEAPVDVVVVENAKSHNRMELTKLIPIKRPTRPNPITFPHLESDIDEESEFRRSPSEFVQAVALPAEPKRYEPDEGPLGKLREEHPDAADIYTTDTGYYELGDGRLVWWEPLNKTIRQNPEPTADGIKHTAPVVAPVVPVVPKIPGKTPHGPVPPGKLPNGMPPGGMPPGMVPPGRMPPGMTPPGGIPPGGAPPGGIPPGGAPRR